MTDRQNTIPQKKAKKQGEVFVQTSVRLPGDLRRRVKIYAAREGLTVQAIHTRALWEYLEDRHA